MNRKLVPLWAAATGTVAALNILDVLPDWTTLTAILTLPVLSAGCLPRWRRA